MKARVLGTRKLDFTAQDGSVICGTQIFVAYEDSQHSNVAGEITEKIFVSADSDVVIPQFVFGDEYDFVYQTVGFGSKARSVLKEILDKDGKQPQTDPYDFLG